ncbi:MAG TPA: class I SAM-dependent methyltransferase [Tepidiformaceae bacterium]|nr:class I SAM-dependent methyltransferase [Tepidiformaceae bacterium]
MTEDVFNELVAAAYDADSPEMFEPELLARTTAFLAELAGDGPALEFAIGTGRVALPLSQRGVTVHGIDISEAMVAKRLEKPGGPAIPVTIGDIASTRVRGEFQVVYIPFNTITNLETQEAQVACFANAAAHLRSGGFFVVDVFVPELLRLSQGERFVPFKVGPAHLGFDEYDVVDQVCVSHHYFVRPDGVQYFRSRHRYAWRPEYDLMAQLAGLELHGRWADWAKARFTGESGGHISVWRKP